MSEPKLVYIEKRGGLLGDNHHFKDARGRYVVRPSWRQAIGFPIRKDWRDRIRVGDILLCGKTERVVRDVLYKREGILVSVDLVIMRCSWTESCYTVVGRSDLDGRGFRPTGKQKRLRSKIDRLIEMAVRGLSKKKMTCCDVEGIR